MIAFGRFHVDGKIALSKCRKRIVAWIVGRKFVNASVAQVQLQLALVPVGHYNGLLSQRELGDTLVGAGQEHPPSNVWRRNRYH